MTYRQIEQHVPILGWLYIIASALFLLLGLVIFVFLSGVGWFAGADDPSSLAILAIVGLFVAGIMAIMGLPGILAGWGLLKRKNWGRVLALIVGILNLFNFPIGTALGAYTLFVLLQPEAAAYFQGEKTVDL
ncbi:MAG: hypothetical protein RRC07_06565 [Anaerolineae bacterium]|nr:hypothetical protein [Anaerolineae bacterium]